MKKTVYTCDFCVQNKPEKELDHIEHHDICHGCMRWILWKIFSRPELYPDLKLTPFCKICNGSRFIIETDFNGIETCKRREHCPNCT